MEVNEIFVFLFCMSFLLPCAVYLGSEIGAILHDFINYIFEVLFTLIYKIILKIINIIKNKNNSKN